MIIDHHNHIWEGESTGGFLDEGMSVKRILKEMDQAEWCGWRMYSSPVHRQ